MNKQYQVPEFTYEGSEQRTEGGIKIIQVWGKIDGKPYSPIGTSFLDAVCNGIDEHYGFNTENHSRKFAISPPHNEGEPKSLTAIVEHDREEHMEVLRTTKNSIRGCVEAYSILVQRIMGYIENQRMFEEKGALETNSFLG